MGHRVWAWQWMTLTLDFQSQILKQPYLRNRRANWQWTIGGHSWPWPWPWGVRSYPIVTRVTSDVGVPSTRLVNIHHNWGFLRIWLSIPNQFVIASYLAVAEHHIMFALHSVSCKKPPTSECIQFFLSYTATYVSYITEYEPCTWNHVRRVRVRKLYFKSVQ